MDRIDQAFRALSRRINAPPTPESGPPVHEALPSLIGRVNRAKRRYDPACHQKSGGVA
ncbi:hypothetical protein WG907_00800 [Sphingobium sp. AN558]|uniref:hypothetical protein n=1 Tax=Sphingobium sp. AN558 TaxID=3133442 RepID=UPI0030BCFA30